MRSKFAIWSDEGILSPKPRSTGFAWIRGTIVVCAVCGIAAAGVYSQIGPDRGTMATDRATGYGTEVRVAEAPRAQSREPSRSDTPSTIDAYVRSGATTGVASSAGTAPKSSTKVAPPPAAEPTSTAATPELAAKPPRPTAPSELTRTDPATRSARRSDDQGPATASSSTVPDNSLGPERGQQRHRTSSAVDAASRSNPRRDNSGRDDVARNAVTNAPREAEQTKSEQTKSEQTKSEQAKSEQAKSEQGDAATVTAGAEPDNNTARAAGNLDERRRSTRRSARRTRDDNYARFESPDGRERSGFVEFGPPPDGRRTSFAEFESWDRRGRNEDPRGSRRYPSVPPFNWFGIPFQ
jgi:hypothetical protein